MTRGFVLLTQMIRRKNPGYKNPNGGSLLSYISFSAKSQNFLSHSLGDIRDYYKHNIRCNYNIMDLAVYLILHLIKMMYLRIPFYNLMDKYFFVIEKVLKIY